MWRQVVILFCLWVQLPSASSSSPKSKSRAVRVATLEPFRTYPSDAIPPKLTQQFHKAQIKARLSEPWLSRGGTKDYKSRSCCCGFSSRREHKRSRIAHTTVQSTMDRSISLAMRQGFTGSGGSTWKSERLPLFWRVVCFWCPPDVWSRLNKKYQFAWVFLIWFFLYL